MSIIVFMLQVKLWELNFEMHVNTVKLIILVVISHRTCNLCWGHCLQAVLGLHLLVAC